MTACCGGLRSLLHDWERAITRLRRSLTLVCHAPLHSASSTWRAQIRLKRCAACMLLQHVLLVDCRKPDRHRFVWVRVQH